MNMQSKRMSMIESVSGLAAGFWLSWFTNVAILPLIGVHMSHGQAWKSVVIFSVLSLARQYVIRRLFVRIGEKKRERATWGDSPHGSLRRSLR